jgi:shikimate kinase
MYLVIIFGPPAVGKMTVGQALAERTGLKLFHNHLSLEIVNQFYAFGSPEFQALDKEIRFAIFRSLAKNQVSGLIFTMVWAFNEPEDEAYIDEVIGIFRERNPQVCLVDLAADLDERLRRNKHPDRLAHKPSKRDLAWSEQNLLSFEADYRMNTRAGEYPDRDILRIDNTHLAPREVAARIIAHFKLPTA